MAAAGCKRADYNRRRAPRFALVFGATDPTGGAGLLLDCRLLAWRGFAPLAVVTGITAQNLNGVQKTRALAAADIGAQYAAVAAAAPRVVKVGALFSAAAARTVAACLRKLRAGAGAKGAPVVVWDPVLAPTFTAAGAAFADAKTRRALRDELLPLADIITPNRAELLSLAKRKSAAAARGALFDAGAQNIVITGGDLRRVRHEWWRGGKLLAAAAAAKLPGQYHGGGCLFSTLLAAEMAAARGKNLNPEKILRAVSGDAVAQLRRAAAVAALGGRQRLII